MYKRLNEKYIKDNNIDIAAIEAHFQEINAQADKSLERLNAMLERVRQADPEYYAEIESQMPWNIDNASI